MTLRDVARAANVSVGTVSKAFSGAADISAETADRIFRAARKLGCYEKYSRSRFPKKVVTLILHEYKSQYYATQAEHAERELTRRGFLVLRAEDSFSPEKQAELLRYYAFYAKVNGILLFSPPLFPLPKGLETPLVCIGNLDPVSNAAKRTDSIGIDFTHAMQNALSLLWEMGHRRIAFLGETLTNAKQKLFLQTVEDDFPSLTTLVITAPGRFEEAGMHGVETLRQLSSDPALPNPQIGNVTALFCAYDNMAVGAMHTCAKLGLRIPEDVSVIGMDDIPVARHLTPALSTVSSCSEELCTAACDLLAKKVDCRYYRARRQVTLDAVFLNRATVAPAKK